MQLRQQASPSGNPDDGLNFSKSGQLLNRTLVYGALTVSLTGIYVGLVMGLSALLRSLISQDNSVAIVLSTLASVVLSQPLRRCIQRLIERRFYRHKYDAARTLADFSAALRQEVDLRQLSEQLVAVVQETVQPTSISLWLCQSAPGKRADVPSLGTQSNTVLEGREPRRSQNGTNTIKSVGLVKEESHG